MNEPIGRGRPLRFLVLLLLAWTGLRITTWTDPWSIAVPLARSSAVREPTLAAASPAHADRSQRDAFQPTPDQVPDQPPLPVPSSLDQRPIERPLYSRPPVVPLFVPGHAAAGHNMLWMAGMAGLPIPGAVARLLGSGIEKGGPERALPESRGLGGALARAGRWRFDGWLQWRSSGSTGTSVAPSAAVLGGPQGGGILSYRLVDGSRERSAFLRVTTSPRPVQAALDGEVAAGVRMQLLRSVPLYGQAEIRARLQGGKIGVAPAAYLVAGVDDEALPLQGRLRAYGAAGWVGGDAPTGFVEGQVVAEREVADFNLAKVSAGVGAWGGAQSKASRLDVGPSLSAIVPVGASGTRVQVDYRVRIAGTAAPASGPTLTLSTGF